MKIQANGKTIRKVLEEQVTYEIPDYQRTYSWTKSEIDDMFTDLKNSILNNSNHYFGAFVLNIERKNSDNIVEVIDGQQRLTTVAIFLYVLRYMYNQDKFKNLDGIEHRRNNLKQLLEYLDDDGQPIGMKLKPGDINLEFYKQFIVNGWDKATDYRKNIIQNFENASKYDACKPIEIAFQRILENINSEIVGLSDVDAIAEIKRFQDVILNKFEIVEIQVEQDADAFLIFETLNDRGLDLSAVDLIKNKLFKNCANKMDFEVIKNNWLDIIQTIDDNSILKKFLRHYWISKYQDLSYKDLYKVVRDKADSSNNSYDFSKNLILELKNTAPYYDSLFNPTNGVISSSKKLIEAITEMNNSNFDLTHPILLSGFRHFKNDEVKMSKLARMCLNFLVRYISVLKKKPSSIEKEIGEVARGLKDDLSIVFELFNKHAKDSEFKEQLKTLNVNHKAYTTYLMLVEYEKSLHINEKWTCPGRSDITIEHILPVTINSATIQGQKWLQVFSKDDHDIYLNRLGNLTLLGPKGQGKAGNKFYDDKLEVYKTHTDMKMTIELCNSNRWDKNEIDVRQAKMANKLVDLFTIDPNKL